MKIWYSEWMVANEHLRYYGQLSCLPQMHRKRPTSKQSTTSTSKKKKDKMKAVSEVSDIHEKKNKLSKRISSMLCHDAQWSPEKIHGVVEDSSGRPPCWCSRLSWQTWAAGPYTTEAHTKLTSNHNICRSQALLLLRKLQAHIALRG